VTCSHPRGGAIMMKSSTSKNDAKEQDDESLLLQKDLNSMKFVIELPFSVFLSKSLLKDHSRIHSRALLPHLISFRISAFLVLQLEYGKFLGRMPRRWTK
jgi:hypothetical protein